MELLTSHVPSSAHGISMGFWCCSSMVSHKRNPLLINIRISKSSPKRRCFTFLPLSERKSVHVSAHFSRHSARRNSLRTKLVESPQVRGNLLPNDPHSNVDVMGPEVDDDRIVKDGLFIYNDSGNEVDLHASTLQGSKSELSSDSALFHKLESWVNQYKEDVEFWGVGSAPIFTVFQDYDGKPESVSIDESEIRRRCGQKFADLDKVNLKFSHAKFLAKEIESGNHVLPSNTSIAKFVVPSAKSGFLSGIQSVTLPMGLFPKLSRVAIVMSGASLVFWILSRMLTVGKEESVKMTRKKNETLEREMNEENERGGLQKVSVEVVEDSAKPPTFSTRRPQLDKKELMYGILKAKLTEGSVNQNGESSDLQAKIQKVREMARRARDIEAEKSSVVDADEEDNLTEHGGMANDAKVVIVPEEESMNAQINLDTGEAKDKLKTNRLNMAGSSHCPESDVKQFSTEAASLAEDMKASITSNTEVTDVNGTASDAIKEKQTASCTLDFSTSAKHFSGKVDHQPSLSANSSVGKKPRIIRSVKEAKEYLSERLQKRGTQKEHLSRPDQRLTRDKSSIPIENQLRIIERGFGPSGSGDTSDITIGANASANFTGEKNQQVVNKIDGLEDIKKQFGLSTSEDAGRDTTMESSINEENWIEKNFKELQPIVDKIGVGFRDNYAVAREKVNQVLAINSDIAQLVSEGDDELEWMKDDGLRNIVYRVRENELAGRDPFHNMKTEDKLAFFEGLEKKVEKENEKLSKVHEWIHSNIENVDYGADGISLYDPPEKFIPRWKGPLLDKQPEFLNNYLEQRKKFAGGSTKMVYPVKENKEESFQKSEDLQSIGNNASSSVFYNQHVKLQNGAPRTPKTIIESSDGSVKAGKKSGKEYWQHTKKWSREFLEVYNAESDPEIKSNLKDMGKDLDRWITEKEIKDAANLMSELPTKQKEFIEKRISKLKREMELFGPQAVVSKYQEYADEKEEDYLWWLDLPFILCLELYTYDNGDQRIGFYSLEMAADLELNPKPHHVIAFEDPGDCKNLGYIIQAHMEMLGNGQAFVVARPPKDAFREAKENGFSVTVIRKGELSLNIDQTLEEVEEQITEIGSKMYHDKIMRGRSVDLSSLMKGVFGGSGRQPGTRKRLRRLLKERAKQKTRSTPGIIPD